MLRSAVIEVEYGELPGEKFPIKMNLIEEMECVRIIRLGENKGSAIVRIKMKPGRRPSEISKYEDHMEFEVLSEENNKYLCIGRENFSEILKNLTGDSNLFSKYVSDDLIFDFPIKFNREKSQFSVIGTQESINGYIELLEEFGMECKLKSMRDHKEFKSLEDVNLTDRQKEITSTALSLGYFDTPKKISSEKLVA